MFCRFQNNANLSMRTRIYINSMDKMKIVSKYERLEGNREVMTTLYPSNKSKGCLKRIYMKEGKKEKKSIR